jgi:hypothetical protein
VRAIKDLCAVSMCVSRSCVRCVRVSGMHVYVLVMCVYLLCQLGLICPWSEGR